MKAFTILNKLKWYIVTVVVLVGGLYYYFAVYSAKDSTEGASFYVVETVEKGDVSSGIRTTGDIIAASKLDIDVYKQLSRIDVVNVQNGGHVEAGDVLISFDKSDAHVETQSSKVAVVEAELALQNERETSKDPNTAIRTKENEIAGFKKVIADSEQDLAVDAYRDFLNEDLEVIAHPDRYVSLDDRTEPTLTGRYVGEAKGQYVVEVYGSGAESGFSYRVTGLESMTGSVIFDKPNNLGTRGLKITFPDDTRSNDKWVVYVPNTQIATYTETEQTYNETVAKLQKTITDAKVDLSNAEQELKNLKATDGLSYRNLSLEKAEASLAEARQRLSENYDVVQDRNIIAPFSGTVEGMANVVAGATPVGGTEDSINLGVLISDDFLTTFTLGATDVANIEVGQKVKVTVTSFSDKPEFVAHITQISSLPDADGVAKYKVQALLEYDRKTALIILREGMLADIEIVEEEKSGVLRVPTSAITYVGGVPKVSVVDTLTEAQKLEVAQTGIIRTDVTPLATYDVEVTLGITGKFYAEVVSGLSEGAIIVSTSLANAGSSESVVTQADPGPDDNEGSGGGGQSGGSTSN
jgi:multidrug efflux pump subunit AcrA (membrane-fusion protein)